MNKCWSFSNAGEYHFKRGLQCQDAADSGVKKGMSYIVVADGAGSFANSKEGAERSVQAVVEYVSDNFERLFEETVLRAKYFITNYIVYELRKIADQKDFKSFGSTIVFLGIKKNRYILYHLGDGAIFSGTKEYHLMSVPTNGETKNSTFLTTTEHAYKFAKLDRGTVTDKYFVAVSDGAYDLFCRQSEKTIWEYIINQDVEHIQEYIKSVHNIDDDYSISFMTVKEI